SSTCLVARACGRAQAEYSGNDEALASAKSHRLVLDRCSRPKTSFFWADPRRSPAWVDVSGHNRIVVLLLRRGCKGDPLTRRRGELSEVVHQRTGGRQSCGGQRAADRLQDALHLPLTAAHRKGVTREHLELAGEVRIRQG